MIWSVGRLFRPSLADAADRKLFASAFMAGKRTKGINERERREENGVKKKKQNTK